MKKNLLTVLILALLIVNIVLTSVMMFSVMGTNKKTAELVNNIATVMNLELTVPGEENKEEISLADTEVFNLSSTMTIPLATEIVADGADGEKKQGRQAYIAFEVALSMNTKNKDYKTYKDTMEDRESLIQDAITSVVAVHTESECRNDLEGLKQEILEAIQNLFQSDFIYKVSISQVKFG